MVDSQILNAMREMLLYAFSGVCIVTVPVLLAGVVLSILQAATQLNEATLTFLPKFMLVFLIVFTLGPWMMEKLAILMQHYLMDLNAYIT